MTMDRLTADEVAERAGTTSEHIALLAKVGILEPDDDGTYAIDFNLAYHPSCVYAPQYSCPLTPAENRLDTRIEAGERLGEGAADH